MIYYSRHYRDAGSRWFHRGVAKWLIL